MSKISALIRKAKDEVVEPKKETLEVLVSDQIVTLVFSKLEPMEWRNLVAMFQPRASVKRDMVMGYNYDLAPSGFPVSHIKTVVDGEESEISQDEWVELYSLLESPDLFAISTVLWGLHEYSPQEAAKKVRAATTKKK